VNNARRALAALVRTHSLSIEEHAALRTDLQALCVSWIERCDPGYAGLRTAAAELRAALDKDGARPCA
jgi:hypothetical protein